MACAPGRTTEAPPAPVEPCRRELGGPSASREIAGAEREGRGARQHLCKRRLMDGPARAPDCAPPHVRRGTWRGRADTTPAWPPMPSPRRQATRRRLDAWRGRPSCRRTPSTPRAPLCPWNARARLRPRAGPTPRASPCFAARIPRTTPLTEGQRAGGRSGQTGGRAKGRSTHCPRYLPTDASIILSGASALCTPVAKPNLLLLILKWAGSGSKVAIAASGGP